MDQLVGQDQCPFVGQGREYSIVGMITTVEEQGRLSSEIGCDTTFKVCIDRKVSGQESGGRGGEGPLSSRFAG